MRAVVLTLGGLCLAMTLGCKKSGGDANEPASPPTSQTGSIEAAAPLVQLASFEGKSVEIGCGMCIYEMPGVDECLPAIVVEGQPILMTGVEIDLHDHDLCTNASKASVTGSVKDGRLVATNVEF